MIVEVEHVIAFAKFVFLSISIDFLLLKLMAAELSFETEFDYLKTQVFYLKAMEDSCAKDLSKTSETKYYVMHSLFFIFSHL